MSKKIQLVDDIASKIKKLYLEENRTKEEVSALLGITMYTLSNYFKAYDIKKSRDEITQKRKQTCLDKYGTDNASKSPIIKQKIKQVNQERYGANAFTATKEGKEKILITKEHKYGSANYNNIEKNRETKLLRYGDPYFSNRKKYIETMNKCYGVNNSFQLKKTLNTHLENLISAKNYNSDFLKYISDRDASIEFLKDKNYSYFDLAKIFNARYYIIQNWVKRLNLETYIDYKFKGKSHYEDEIANFIKKDLNISNVVLNSKILNGQEIDIYLPDYKLGIEFNGTYWHSDLFKEKTYHFNKSKLSESLGIRLIHIYQYEWEDTKMQQKIKQLLRIACGQVKNKIYARKCEIRVITNKEAKPFNELTHLQGHRNAKVTYGLFYNNELVQLMSFSKLRYNKNIVKGSNNWEIIRGCPGSNNIVIGGVGKLFSHFIKDYNPDNIFSYCDFNKFNGKSYEEIGMKFIGYTGYDLKYIIGGKVYNRQHGNYKNIKDKIDARIYGAGSKKYLWTKLKC